MNSKKISSKLLDQILDETIYKVSESKNEVFEIGELSRKEFERLLKKLENIKIDVAKVIDERDLLEEKTRLARNRLAKVSHNFNKYTEEDVKQVYETANDLQIKLNVLREREIQLRERRDELERRLLQVKETISKAENLTRHISVVLNYLSGDLKRMGELIEDANRRQTLGLRIIEAQEEERRRLSREIHDGPAQMLANMLLRSELIEKKIQYKGTDAAIAEFRELRQLVRNSLQEVRRIIYDLRPMALDDFGLIPTLKKYINTVSENFGTEVTIQIIGQEKRLASNLEIALFRLAQEAVQNACKHAKASQIQVKVEFRDEQLTLLVKDNGIGFDYNVKKENAFGLIGMNERVDLLEGKFMLESTPEKGTTILIQIPIKKQEVRDEVYN
ncbi:histidine kinase [Pueribacillus theae]|uniref:Signal transduction histidine-protein kinase/phosphatase DegS n=1 Tax=Pueribacillus theae TaxID=2171751 RepID=A0A2U1K5V9_9BACI|nr:sensor histidine kinase [Pueribacillus theae]PWA12635.1 histidine kinase [Pueribacillus theae]